MTRSATPEALWAQVLQLLAENGYSELASRVDIGDVSLEIPNLWESPPENLDLSLISDRPSSRESELRLYWLVQRLVRALDAAGSRRTVTVILVGEPSPYSGLGELIELARVLVVDGSLATERMIGPLLKLRLPATASTQLDGLAEVTAAIAQEISASDLHRLIDAASFGATSVSDRYRAWLDESFLS